MNKIIFTSLSFMLFSHTSLAMDFEPEEFTQNNPCVSNITQRPVQKTNQSDVLDNKEISKQYFNRGLEEYENGKKGSPTAYKRAAEHFLLAAKSDQQNDLAQNNLAVMYEYGLGVNKDIKLAKEWYEKAENNGNTRAKISRKRISEKENFILNRIFGF